MLHKSVSAFCFDMCTQTNEPVRDCRNKDVIHVDAELHGKGSTGYENFCSNSQSTISRSGLHFLVLHIDEIMPL